MFMQLKNGNIALFGRMETIEERKEIEKERPIELNDEVVVLTKEEWSEILLGTMNREILVEVLGNLAAPVSNVEVFKRDTQNEQR